MIAKKKYIYSFKSRVNIIILLIVLGLPFAILFISNERYRTIDILYIISMVIVPLLILLIITWKQVLITENRLSIIYAFKFTKSILLKDIIGWNVSPIKIQIPLFRPYFSIRFYTDQNRFVELPNTENINKDLAMIINNLENVLISAFKEKINQNKEIIISFKGYIEFKIIFIIMLSLFSVPAIAFTYFIFIVRSSIFVGLNYYIAILFGIILPILGIGLFIYIFSKHEKYILNKDKLIKERRNELQVILIENIKSITFRSNDKRTLKVSTGETDILLLRYAIKYIGFINYMAKRSNCILDPEIKDLYSINNNISESKTKRFSQ